MFAELVAGRGLIGFIACQLDEIKIPKKNMQTPAKDIYQYSPNYTPRTTDDTQLHCLIGKDGWLFICRDMAVLASGERL